MTLDMVGQRFGKLVVVSMDVDKTTTKRKFWTCHCDCGKAFSTRADGLRNGRTVHCGCDFQKPFEDLTGRVFARYTVISFAGFRGSMTRWLCRCECGAEKVVARHGLVQGTTKSCGCWHSDRVREFAKRVLSQSQRTHGRTRTREYTSWQAMIKRCTLVTDPSYPEYGGRGIVVCDRWLASFENFYADMGCRPQGCTLGRKDNDGHYDPSNVRWETWKQQQGNRRSCRYLEYKGEIHCVAVWAERFGLSRSIVYWRLNAGWTISRALETRPRKRCDNRAAIAS